MVDVPTLDDVSRIAAALPGNEEKPAGGGLAWFVRRKAYAWESMPWPSEPAHVREIVSGEPCIGLRLPGEDDKRALVQGWPDVFIDSTREVHDARIIIRLNAIDPDHLAELVTESWRTQAPRYLRNDFDGGAGFTGVAP